MMWNKTNAESLAGMRARIRNLQKMINTAKVFVLNYTLRFNGGDTF